MGKKKKKKVSQKSSLDVKNSVGAGYGRHGASSRSSGMRSYYPYSHNADDDIVRNLDELRARSRDLFMGSAIAAGAVKTVRTNVVGSGLMLSAQIDEKVLDLTPDEARDWEEKTEKEWLLWSGSTDCDAERRQTFYQLQSLVLLSVLISGDVFVALPLIKRPNSPYDLKVSLIEADRVCNPMDTNLSSDKNVLGGVEIGPHGEAVAFYIASRNPSAYPVAFDTLDLKWQRVPAVGPRTGRPNILQVMSDTERPNQRRGVPFLAPIIEAIKQLSDYSQAEIDAAVISAKFTAYVKSSSNKSLGLPVPPAFGIPPGTVPPADGKDPRDYLLGNGAIVFMDPDEDIVFADPKRPNTAFGEFVQAVCRQIGAALELPYELVVKQFTASYSASRGALLEAWKMFKMRREWLISSFCQPVYEEWLTEAILKGRIKAPGFFDDPAIRRAWCRAEWFGDTQGQLDPVKEANAAAIRVDNFFSTREREAAELTGLKIDQIVASRAQEESQIREAGLLPAAESVSEEETQEENTDTENEVENEG